MTINELEQYRQLQQEIKQLYTRLERLQDTKSHIVADSVKGSSHQSPYQQKIIPITGINKTHEKTYHRIKEILESRINRTHKIIVDIEEFISTLADSEMRRIVDYRYVQGFSWKATSKRVYGYPSEDRARKAVARFFNEQQKGLERE